jgi:membrane protein
MLSVIKTFDLAIYKQRKNTNFIKKRIKAIRLTIVVLGLLIGTILLLIGQGILFDKVMTLLHIKGSDVLLIKLVRWVITLSLFFYGISYIYKYAPTVKKRWSTFSPGSILATVLTIATTYAFSYWVNHFSRFNKIYGSISSVLILMLFIYLISFILLIGFELNVSITYLKDEADQRQQKEIKGKLQKEIPNKLNQQKT